MLNRMIAAGNLPQRLGISCSAISAVNPILSD
jgi:hypothetical protein